MQQYCSEEPQNKKNYISQGTWDIRGDFHFKRRRVNDNHIWIISFLGLFLQFRDYRRNFLLPPGVVVRVSLSVNRIPLYILASLTLNPMRCTYPYFSYQIIHSL